MISETKKSRWPSRKGRFLDRLDALEASVSKLAILMHGGSGALTGYCTYLHLENMDASFSMKLGFAVVIGGLTTVALSAFTMAATTILPRLKGDLQMVGSAVAAGGIAAVIALSGSSNATAIAYPEARRLEERATLAEAETAFGDAQRTVRQMAQVLPLLTAGEEIATALKADEDRNGRTGPGQGPIYGAILAQETRLAATRASVEAFEREADQTIRAGQRILDTIRATLKDAKAGVKERERTLENGLSRLQAAIISLREAVPYSSLKAIADQLRQPVQLGRYAADDAKRSLQKEASERLQAEFGAIGQGLEEAVTGLQDMMASELPTYRRLSPTGLVFEHADELTWALAMGFALDLLPFGAVLLLLLAHKQAEQLGHEPLPLDDRPERRDEPERRLRPVQNRREG